VWVKPVIVTVTFWTVPKPETVMFDGYGLAGPLSGIVIGAELVKTTGGQGVPVGVGVAVDGAVGVAVAGAVGVAVAGAVGVALGDAVGVGVGVPQGVRM